MDDHAKDLMTKKANQPRKASSLRSYAKSMVPAFEKALPDSSQAERFSRAVLTALSTNPQLNNCTPESFCGAMMMSAQLGLIPNTPEGLAYLIPYGNECQFQLGYQGLIQLVWRSGQVRTIQAHVVYSKDEFEYSYGLHPTLFHKPCKEANRGDPVYCYATFETISGGYGFEVMSVEEIRAHAKKYSKSYNSKYSPWQTNFESMAKKTVLKQALKYAPMSTDFNRQLAADESIKQTPTSATLMEDVDVLDLPNEFVYEVEDVPFPDAEVKQEDQQSFK